MERYSHEVEEGEIFYTLSLGVLTLKYSLNYIKICRELRARILPL